MFYFDSESNLMIVLYLNRPFQDFDIQENYSQTLNLFIGRLDILDIESIHSNFLICKNTCACWNRTCAAA